MRIFRHHLGAGALAGDSLMPLALAARGKTGADVEAFVRRARGAARRAGRQIGLDDVLAEIRQGRIAMSPEARRRSAIHEAGHAIVGRSLGCGALVDLSIHDGGGQAQFEYPVDGAATLPKLEATLATVLAGRAAEQIEFGGVSICSGFGPGSDLAQATALAHDIDLQFGLGKLGPYYVDPAERHLFLAGGLVDTAVDRLRGAYARARAVLETQTTALRAITLELAEVGYLSAQDIDRIMLDHPATASPAGTPVPALEMGAA
ncbi:hypothetical protein [Methylobacterium sp. J-077]|uniref:hypothetical protein n=1 Tax=Methylobacterium sp. J-077 TaxID=2836656 RepID=UPI001FBBE3C3|nr:hypothetical protein [Methylobacterium sp. J-077]MCJ2125282.1 hypothetical protein [Methylobacterium sp. J-077]